MCDSYGTLRLDLISSDTILTDSMGEDGEVNYKGDDLSQTELDVDFITCSLRQHYRYRRSLKDNACRILQNEATLECNAPKDELDKGNKWRIKAHITLRVGGENVLDEKVDFDSKRTSYSIGLASINGSNGTVFVDFVQAFALCAAPRVNLSNETDLRDFPLITEGVRFYVNRGFLASISPVFYSMFYGEFIDREKQSIEMKDISKEQMETFLQVIHGATTVTKINVESMLEMADRFCIEWLRAKCADVIIRLSQKSPAKDYTGFYDRLELADRWKLAKVQAHLVEKMDKSRLSALTEEKIRVFEPDTCQLLLAQAVKHLSTK